MDAVPEDLHYLDLTELAARIEVRAVSPVAVTRAQLDRIGRLDGTLGSYALVLADAAMAEAEAAEAEIAAGRYRGPLHGVPIAVKDLCWTKGSPTAAGMEIHKNYRPGEDATVVRRLRQAGAVLLGKLQLTEGAYSDHHPLVTPPKNPWGRDYWPGISSSGPGVATAAGLCYGALASDTGGSIRWPSAANGVTGLKPTWGRVSRYGVFELAPTLDHVGPMARSAADAGALLGAIAGRDPNDPTAVLDPVPDYLAAVGRHVRGLRVGIDPAWNGDDVAPATQAVLAEAAEVFRALGGTIVDVKFPDVTQAIADWAPNCAVEAAVAHAATYPARKDDYGPVLASVIEAGRAAPRSARPRRGPLYLDRPAADTRAPVRTADPRHDPHARRAAGAGRRVAAVHLPLRHDRPSDDHAAGRFQYRGTADRLPARRHSPGRSDADSGRRGVSGPHVLASPPSTRLTRRLS
jgi:amidase